MFRRFIGGVAVSGLLLAAGAAMAQDFTTQRLSDEIRHISSDDFQGRYPGTEGERKVLDWLQAQYEAMGFTPGGPNGQWLQHVELHRYTPVADTARASWTGPDGQTHALTLGTDAVVRSATNDGQADVQNAELVFAGYGITAPERNWDDYGRIDVRGKVVVVLTGEPEGDLFNGPYDTYYATAARKADEAFARGAVGLVLVPAGEAGQSAWRRAVGSARSGRALAPGAADLEFQTYVSHDVAMAWGQAARLDHALMSQVGSGTFKAVPLTGVRLSVQAQERRTTIVTHNLMAKIEGTTHPDEYLIYSAHWDHVGTAANHPDHVGDDQIYNGAWDNASGTIGILEMARQFKAGPAPQRTVIFAHMAAEEMGLLGAYAYAADPVYPLERTVADINIDMLPLSGPTRDLPIFGKGQNDLEDRLQAILEPQGRYVSDDGNPSEGFFYRSDHFPYARMGVPAIMPWHGVDWVDGGREAGQAAWNAKFAADYHKPSDEWSADWDLRSAVENLTVFYRLGQDLANSRDWPQWKPTSEFGAIRARSDAARR